MRRSAAQCERGGRGGGKGCCAEAVHRQLNKQEGSLRCVSSVRSADAADAARAGVYSGLPLTPLVCVRGCLCNWFKEAEMEKGGGRQGGGWASGCVRAPVDTIGWACCTSPAGYGKEEEGGVQQGKKYASRKEQRARVSLSRSMCVCVCVRASGSARGVWRSGHRGEEQRKQQQPKNKQKKSTQRGQGRKRKHEMLPKREAAGDSPIRERAHARTPVQRCTASRSRCPLRGQPR